MCSAGLTSSHSLIQIMELKWLLYVALLALGTLAVQAHDMDDDNDGDDVVDIEDDLDDGIEEVEESKPGTSSPPPAPKVWHGTSLKFSYCLCCSYCESDLSSLCFANA